MPPLHPYITSIAATHAGGISTEHSFRADLQQLIQELLPDVDITNEPRRIACGAPDYVLTRNAIPLGYIEAKNVDKSLEDDAHRAQLKRYVKSLDNLIFTNYIEFRFHRDGEMKPQAAVAIAELRGGKIKPLPQNFDQFTDLLSNFGAYQGQTITSANDLAGRMAHKARMLAATITNALTSDSDEDQAESDLTGQLDAFKRHLIHDLDVAGFADIYAQTVAYGMFTARLHDPTPSTFTRREAAGLIPSTNPFLRKFFRHIAGEALDPEIADHDLDQRIRWIVDDLADVFRAADVGELMKDYGKATQQNDPFIHFYETFLGEYNPALRKSRGVYYTPEPVVDFIVRAVDEILKSEFHLKDGIADTAKTTVTVDDKPKEIHKVQILDPATGTGTFLAAIVQAIYENRFAGQQGIWQQYVEQDLVPRLNGFEVLLAPYAMAHTKLEMVLRDSGCDLGNKRLRVFLTNSLEEHHPDTTTLFARWLAIEANEANLIKRDTPVMVVVGNPPYSGISSNMGEWINELIEEYKYVDGEHFGERKHWLHDDYVKFIRYGEHLVEKTGEGVLAYINNHSFLDNPTFRGMRWHLLKTFDKIFVLDLHGNSKKKEVSPDGSPDKNVFDIQQGVSINLFVKTGKKKEGDLGEVFHCDLFGERQSKYEFLRGNDLNQVDFLELKPQSPKYFFVPKNYEFKSEYDEGFSVAELFPLNSVGIVTARDKFTIYHTPQDLKTTVTKFRAIDDETAREKFSLRRDVQGWKISTARKDLEENIFTGNNDKPMPISYRPFDIRYTYYTGNSKGFHSRPLRKIMRHFIDSDNVGLTVSKQFKGSENYFHAFITDHIFESSLVSNKTSEIGYGFPLYLYPEEKQQTLDKQPTRKPNLNPDIIKTIADQLTLRFTPEKTDEDNTFAPIDLLDYIYATLHSPTYRRKYREFLKIDFPRVPYPANQKQFRALAKLGAELRALHLMDSPKLNTPITTYPQPGDNTVTQIKYDAGKVWLNKTQHFTNIPQTAWNFQIGGYQPAQKYLKDRKGRVLSWEEIEHYQKVIVALVETAGVMERIDKN